MTYFEKIKLEPLLPDDISFDSYARRRFLVEMGLGANLKIYKELKKSERGGLKLKNGLMAAVFRGNVPLLGSDGKTFSVSFDYDDKIVEVDGFVERNFRTKKEVEEILQMAENTVKVEKDGGTIVFNKV